MRQFEWSDLKFFLELARAGSPSAAARRLRADHTTVRRRVGALEEALRTRLISSRGARYELTPEGDRLVGYAEAVENLTSRAEEELANHNLNISGTVRIGAPDGLGALYLAPRLTEFAATNPTLKLQLVIVPRVVNLTNREADIAISTSPPNQHRQIVRRVADFSLGLYSSPRYLETAPEIMGMEDLKDHRFVGYIPDLLFEPELDNLPTLGIDQGGTFESSSIFAQIEAVVAGAGICVLPDFVASCDPRLQRILPNFSLPRQFWMIIHPEMINLAKVRAVIDFICEVMRRDRSLFIGQAGTDAAATAA